VYGVAPIGRLLEITGLFCKRALQKRLYSAKETYHLKEPTNRSHPTGHPEYRVAKTHWMPEVASHFPPKKPISRGLFCGKWPVKIRHPMGMRHSATFPTHMRITNGPSHIVSARSHNRICEITHGPQLC